MSICFSLACKKDKQRWDDFVLAHDNATAYHLFAWGEAVVASYDFTMEYWMATADDGLIAILPAIKMRSLTGKMHLCSLPYCDLGGMLVKAVDAEQQLHIQTQFMQHISEHYSDVNIANIEIRDSAAKGLEATEVQKGEKVRMLLPLPNDADTLMAQFKSKLRSQIRKAEKNGLTFRVLSGDSFRFSHGANEDTAGEQAFNDFYAIIAENMRLLGSPVHAKAWYQSLIESYKDKLYIAIVDYDDIAAGAALVLTTNNKAVIPWASTRAQYNRLAPNMLLYWAVLSEACHRNMQEFDFGRSTVGEGTYKFKQQWGCVAQALSWKHYYNGALKDDKELNSSFARALAENAWRKLPLALTTALGARIRKYISL
ncbi:GNAT family N-acetyltransferase [Glaciecola siphonariae]|uniref:GNAT family N-acetyltransferase n=1 Tax=Glaciecola siphonariae TaxID=521012 RepID=A0ABV9LVS9_9ALTE